MAVCHYWDNKYIIHSEIFPEPTPDILKTVKKISKMIDDSFKERGIETLYTWAETDEQKRYNLFLGYSPTGETVNETFQDKEYPFTVYEYKKDLI